DGRSSVTARARTIGQSLPSRIPRRDSAESPGQSRQRRCESAGTVGLSERWGITTTVSGRFFFERRRIFAFSSIIGSQQPTGRRQLSRPPHLGRVWLLPRGDKLAPS